MDLTRDIEALEELPESGPTGLRWHWYRHRYHHVNVNCCYRTCGVTQVNDW